MFNPAYIGVITIGLLHGLEPGHGWPVAVLYSAKKKHLLSNAVLSAGILGVGHLVSSVAVVAAYVLLQSWLDFEAPWIKYLAAAVLLFLAVRMFREKPDTREDQHGHSHEDQVDIQHDHEHEHAEEGLLHSHLHSHTVGVTLSLWGLAGFAFLLGFAHEEEFALLALVAGGVNAWILMLSYAAAVLLGLMAVTIVCAKIYRSLQYKLVRYEPYIPKISASILVVMAIIVIFW